MARKSQNFMETEPSVKSPFQKKKNTAKNIVVPPNFLVWKFCGKAQYPQSFGRIARNSAGTVPLHKTSTSGNWVELP